MLGLLSQQPGTGYELTQRFDRSLTNAWHASHSQIYPELAKLQEQGLVEVIGEGARNSRTYAITDARPRGDAPLAASRPSPTAPSATRARFDSS